MATKTNSRKKSVRNGRNKDGTFAKGNPGGPGRPEGTLSLVSMLKKKLEEVPKGKKASYAQMVIDRWLNDAIVKGDANLLKEIVRYVDGMPTQKIDGNLNLTTPNVYLPKKDE